MDVIANACAIRRGVVVPKNLKLWNATCHRSKYQWDQVNFQSVILAKVASRISSSRIEITKDQAGQTVGRAKITDHLLYDPLAKSTGTNWVLRAGFSNRDLILSYDAICGTGA